MIKHIILWKIKESINEEQKAVIKKNVKTGLEELKSIIPGIVEIKVVTDTVSGSNSDLMLDSTFTDEAALSAYSTNPAHVKVADTFVRPNMEVRMCINYEC